MSLEIYGQDMKPWRGLKIQKFNKSDQALLRAQETAIKQDSMLSDCNSKGKFVSMTWKLKDSKS